MAVTSLSLDDIKDVNTFADTFWAKVDFGEGPDTCWLWQSGLTNKGYGSIGVPLWRGSKPQLAHRIAWLLTYGELPLLFLCHTCDVRYEPGDISYRRCMNPDHLFPGTNADNIQDMYNKGRGRKVSAVGEQHGLTTITDIQAREIFTRYKQGARQDALALTYSVSLSVVRGIVQGKTWKHLDVEPLEFGKSRAGTRNGRSKLNEDMVRSIKSDLTQRMPVRKIALKYGVSKGAINYIQRGIHWAHVK